MGGEKAAGICGRGLVESVSGWLASGVPYPPPPPHRTILLRITPNDTTYLTAGHTALHLTIQYRTTLNHTS